MKAEEKNAKTPPAKTGLRATPRVFVADPVGGGSLSGCLRLVLALVPLALTLALAPGVALAISEAPKVNYVATQYPVTHTSVGLVGSLAGTGTAETYWRLEYSTSRSALESGAGTVVSAGTLPPFEYFVKVTGKVTGLSPETIYYARLFAENQGGHEETITSFEAVPLHPRSFCCNLGKIAETSAHLTGSVIPDGFETHWRFEYATAENGHTPAENSPSWTAVPGAKGTIPQAVADESYHEVEAVLAGLKQPDTTYYIRLFAENEPEWPHGSGERRHLEATSGVMSFETAGPPTAATLSFHALVGEGIRLFGNVDPHGLPTDYSFQFVAADKFKASGFAEAESTPEAEGESYVGQDLPQLEPGVEYHFRVLATNRSEATGESRTAYGEDQTLKAPVPAPAAAASCPNEALRTGPSARLPDCRAYEQLTPAEKGGAMDIYPFHRLFGDSVLVGESGEDVIYDGGNTKWEPSPGAVESFYSFSRTPAGWRTTSLTPQPEGAVSFYKPTLFNSDLTQVGVAVSLQGKSTEELEAGPPGGPYTPVVAAPASSKTRWVAAAAGFGTFVLQTEDRELLKGHSSGTTSGTDLYEWSAGRLAQLNVLSDGAAIGACGATMVGDGTVGGHFEAQLSSAQALSPSGSRVFFYATPGANCSEPPHLYMRVGGAETVDIGVYSFLGDDPAGAELLLRAGGEYFRYGTEAQTLQPLSLAELNGAYEQLGLTPPGAEPFQYGDGDQFQSDEGGVSVLSLPGKPAGTTLPVPGAKAQVWRYDRAENAIECLSCASPFDPEPRQRAQFVQDAFTLEYTVNGVPNPTTVSANGDYVFFETASALLPEDVNGEIPADNRGQYFNSSPSVDIYEWRADGVTGCAHVQGCLALITNGIDGSHNVLLGTTPSGRDVFFATHSQLVAQDQDNAGDIYDARIGGGFPPPPPGPVECEGAACHSPLAAPIDTTPASLAFSGPGDPPAAPPAARPKKARPRVKPSCGAGTARRGGRCVKAKRRQARRAARRAASRRRGGAR